eukprot:SAG11_NODE_33817_length_275_cov_0.630682_1_plen_23_part_10
MMMKEGMKMEDGKLTASGGLAPA